MVHALPSRIILGSGRVMKSARSPRTTLGRSSSLLNRPARFVRNRRTVLTISALAHDSDLDVPCTERMPKKLILNATCAQTGTVR